MIKYWEDYEVGAKFKSPGRTLGEGMIDIFIGLTGATLSFFRDQEFAKKTMWKARVVPGPVTVLLMFGLEHDAELWHDESMLGLLGIDKVKFKMPVRAGDTITNETEIVGKKETKSPEQGIIFHHDVCRNQNGEEVVEFEGIHLIKRRT